MGYEPELNDPVFYQDDEDLCEVCDSNEKEFPDGKWCISCKDDFKESEGGR
jgi:hypothetical protein